MSAAQKTSVSAVIGGAPLGIKQPKPLPGETMLQCIIRTHPSEWNNFLDRLGRDHGLSSESRARLSRGQLGQDELRIAKKEIEAFINDRIPFLARTVKNLADLRDSFNDPLTAMLAPISLNEIVIPRLAGSPPALQQQYQIIAGIYRAKTVDAKVTADGGLSVAGLISEITGDYVWVVSGGTRFSVQMTAIALRDVLERFQGAPGLAMLFDGKYTTIYRTSVLHEFVKRGSSWPGALSEQAKQFEAMGYTASTQRVELVELEPLYGG